MALIAGGVKVVLHTVNRHVDRDTWLARGVHGFFSDDPYYLNTDPARYRMKVDPFKGQTFPHGFQWTQRAGTTSRDTFTAPRWWTMQPNS
ncbi:hypothetical protein Lfu02_73100 [Longispora fulva]|uniref:Uncharacterized protein n=1 Tax=Longispora fulva TaxID=619741 RepID=A0A8J7GDV2_9ACTN|nr:hypothetical protein [Longispora fulva]MBG6133898.1 hypothetical protein [Longispora fulva]GIG62938.1 hypothetical protein Lfu02_73100 [Longispora fulva]